MKSSLFFKILPAFLIYLASFSLHAAETPTNGQIEIKARTHLSLPQVLSVRIDSDALEDDMRSALEQAYEVMAEQGVLILDEAKFTLYVKKQTPKPELKEKQSIKMSLEGSNKKLNNLQLDIPKTAKNKSNSKSPSLIKNKEVILSLEGPAGTPYWVAVVKGTSQPPSNISYAQLIKAGLTFLGENQNQIYSADKWQ